MPADQNDLINLGRGLLGVGQCLAAGLYTLIHQLHYQLLQFCPGKGNTEVLGTAGISGDKGEVYLGLLDGGKLTLSLFRGFLQSL